MRLTVIGSGDAFGSGGRFNACFMIESDGRTVLLDCGASAPVALKMRKIDLNAIDGVILSHLHGERSPSSCPPEAHGAVHHELSATARRHRAQVHRAWPPA
jgi:hypothetical protein